MKIPFSTLKVSHIHVCVIIMSPNHKSFSCPSRVGRINKTWNKLKVVYHHKHHCPGTKDKRPPDQGWACRSALLRRCADTQRRLSEKCLHGCACAGAGLRRILKNVCAAALRWPAQACAEPCAAAPPAPDFNKYYILFFVKMFEI